MVKFEITCLGLFGDPSGKVYALSPSFTTKKLKAAESHGMSCQTFFWQTFWHIHPDIIRPDMNWDSNGDMYSDIRPDMYWDGIFSLHIYIYWHMNLDIHSGLTYSLTYPEKSWHIYADICSNILHVVCHILFRQLSWLKLWHIWNDFWHDFRHAWYRFPGISPKSWWQPGHRQNGQLVVSMPMEAVGHSGETIEP